METWHDLRKNPLDLPQRKTSSNGGWYYQLVLCFEYREDDHGKKTRVYGLDTYNPYPFNEWEKNKRGWDAWKELPEPPKEKRGHKMTEDARKELKQKAHDYTWETLLLNENDPTFKAVADAYIAGAEGYEKQKEINKELVDDIAELHKRIRELETQIKLGNEREAQDIRARFPC